MKKKILVLHTGGTISMKEDEQTGSVVPQESSPFSHVYAKVSEYAELIIEEPFQLPSPHITPYEMLTLKQIISEHINRSNIDGVVITHGTDTLEETAYFLDLTVDSSIPIVVTGAMRSSNEIGSDGLYNFICAVRTAICEEAIGKGVLVVLNDEIHSAMNVTKTHTSNVSTFQSPQYGPIGIITKKRVRFHHSRVKNEKYDIHSITKKVLLLKAYAGMDSALFHACRDMEIDGLVIEALGQGNLPPQTLDGIQSLIQKRIPIVLVSRCFNGTVEDIYGYLGGGAHLKELGLIFSNGLNGQKARMKLMIALEHTSDLSEIEKIFQS